MSRARLAAAAVLLMLAALAAAYVHQEIERRRLARELAAAQMDLVLSNLHRKLGVAALALQQGSQEEATVAAREFFEGCRKAVYTHDFTDEPRTRIALGSYGAQGDSILMAMAAADPAVQNRLASLYLTMEGVLVRRAPGRIED